MRAAVEPRLVPPARSRSYRKSSLRDAIRRVEVGEDGHVQVQEPEDLAYARPADLLASRELGRRAVGVFVEPRAPASGAVELCPDAGDGASPRVYRRLLGAWPVRMTRSRISWPSLSGYACYGSLSGGPLRGSIVEQRQPSLLGGQIRIRPATMAKRGRSACTRWFLS